MGASGTRIFVFEVNDPTAELRLGLSRPGEYEDDSVWEGTAGDDDLDDHLFYKRIQFSPGS